MPPVTLDYLQTARPLSMPSPLHPAHADAPSLTLSLTFCNHEILMTDIEFKVQFVSESFGGKGSCKGTAFKETGVGGAGGCIRLPPAGSAGPKLVWRAGIHAQESQTFTKSARCFPL